METVEHNGELLEVINDPDFKKNKRFQVEYIKNIVEPENSERKRLYKAQGAKIINPDLISFYGCTWIHRTDERGFELNGIQIVILNDNMKLSQLFDKTPYGILKKHRTGIGATTLELRSNRNSIIVVPTKALALDKVEKSRISRTNRYNYLYIGGKIEGKTFPRIPDYLADSSIPYKKFVVVADSLPKLVAELGDEIFTDYFFMVDEIDSYQYDSHYRPALEDVIDYYLKFHYTQRCLVSATIKNFSNEALWDETQVYLSFVNDFKRSFDLIHTDNVIIATVEKIKELLISNPNDKILVAFNSVTKGIQKIIQLLDPELQEQCAVLCSIKSKIYVEKYYHDNTIQNTLPKKINFMTSSYFVGIDILERFHLVSVCTAHLPYTLLSDDKFIQIVGRCRHKDGVYSETIIYNTKEENELSRSEWYNVSTRIKSDAALVIDYYNNMEEISRKFPRLIKSYPWPINEVIKRSHKSYFGTRHAALVRKNIYGELVPAYFNIDSIKIQLDLLRKAYSSEENLKGSILNLRNKEYTVNCLTINYGEEEVSEKSEPEGNDALRFLEKEELIEQLRECEAGSRAELAGRIKVRASYNGSIFIDRLLELIDYVPFEELVDRLSNKMSRREYNAFYNSVIYWALAESHPLKLKIKRDFLIGNRYTNVELAEKVNSIFSSLFEVNNMSHRTLVERASVFIKKKRVRERGGVMSRYLVQSYNVNDFKGDPLKLIHSRENVKSYFRF